MDNAVRISSQWQHYHYAVQSNIPLDCIARITSPYTFTKSQFTAQLAMWYWGMLRSGFTKGGTSYFMFYNLY